MNSDFSKLSNIIQRGLNQLGNQTKYNINDPFFHADKLIDDILKLNKKFNEIYSQNNDQIDIIVDLEKKISSLEIEKMEFK